MHSEERVLNFCARSVPSRCTREYRLEPTGVDAGKTASLTIFNGNASGTRERSQKQELYFQVESTGASSTSIGSNSGTSRRADVNRYVRML